MQGRSEAPHLSAPVHCLTTLSRLALPIKWKRDRGGSDGEEEPATEPSSSEFFSDDSFRDTASCSLQLCFQLCLVGLDGVYEKGPSGPLLEHVD